MMELAAFRTARVEHRSGGPNLANRADVLFDDSLYLWRAERAAETTASGKQQTTA